MNRKKGVFVLTLALCCLCLSSCIKEEPEIKDVRYSAEAEWGVPLAQVFLSAERVIDNFDEEGLISTGEDGLISIIYSDTLAPVNANDFMVLPDQSFEAAIALGDAEFAQLNASGSLSISETRTYEYPTPEGDRLDSVRFDSGVFNLRVESGLNVEVSGTLSVLDGVTQEALYIYEFQDAQPPVLINESSSLENVLLTFGNNGSGENVLIAQYDLELVYNGDGGNAHVEIDFEMSDLKVRSVGGYIAPRTIDLDDEGLFISMFDDLRGAQIRVEDPRINFFFDNGFGLGARLEIENITGVNAGGESLNVPGSDITELPVIQAAASPGKSVITELRINNDLMTPSVTDFLAFYPNYVTGQFALNINPENDASSFLSRDAQLRLSYEAEIPVYGSISDFNISDTAAINLDDVLDGVDDVEEIAEVEVRIIVDNGLPIVAGLQMVFTDSLYQPVDSLFEDFTDVFESAPLELTVPDHHPNYGRAIGSTRTVLKIPVARHRVEALEDVTHIVFRVVGHTSSNGAHPIRLFAENSFNVRVAARVKLDINE